MSPKPPIKWVGGKTNILSDILARFPAEMENYFEPFIGGGSVLIALLESKEITVHKDIIACDLNETLIWMYKNIQSRPRELIKELLRIEQQMKSTLTFNGNRNPNSLEEALESSESYYYFSRRKYNDMTPLEKNGVRGSALFIFLNKIGFRGLHRVGPNGFNVPFGNYKSPTICDEKNILELSAIFQSVKFIHQDYKTTLDSLVPGDFVYLDPPYVPSGTTSFVKYNADGFEKEHLTLFARCKELANSGIYFCLSNSDTEIVREQCSGLLCETISGCRRAINSKNPSSTVNELIIRPDVL